MNEPQLIRTIRAHIEKGDRAAEKSEQHYIAAGQHLKALKAQMPTGIKWEQYLKDHGLEIGRRRADELIAIADGRATVEEVRAEKAESAARSRAALALRSAEAKETIQKYNEKIREAVLSSALASELVAAATHGECAHGEKLRAAEIKIAGLESEVQELKAENARLREQLWTARSRIEQAEEMPAIPGFLLRKSAAS